MKKYVLLQAPVESGEYVSKTIIIDNSDKIGKGKVEKYVAEGYKTIGHIESNLGLYHLKACLDYQKNKKIDALDSKIRKIYDILQE